MTRHDVLNFGILGILFLVLVITYGWMVAPKGVANLAGSSREYENFRVVVDALPVSIAPASGDASANHVLLNLYEGLVKVDGFFRVVPGLAYSWGNMDEEGLWWEFKIRDGVQFHNGTAMTIEHIKASMEWYWSQREESEYIAQLLSSVERFEYGEQTVRVKTLYPDPLLLYRLSTLFVVLQGGDDMWYGTGPYLLGEHDDVSLVLEAFPAYWGAVPAVKRAEFAVVADPYTRQQQFLNQQIDVLLAVPAQLGFVEAINGRSDMELLRIPSLELVYMMFRVQRGSILADPVLREAIISGIQRSGIASIPMFAKVAEQYVASGVFGYDIQRPPITYAPERTRELLSGRYLTVELALPRSFQVIGEAIRSSLDPLNITVNLRVFGDDQMEAFLEGIANQEFEMYLVGTKYDLADSVEFFRGVVHSPEGEYGSLNGSGFRNVEVDDQIQRSERLLDQEERLLLLQQLQSTVLDAQIGLPLFEVDKVFAKKASVTWQPRMDGYMVLSEVR